MDGRRTARRLATLIAGALLATSGCTYLTPPPAAAYGPAQQYQPAAQPYEQPPQPYEQPPQPYQQPSQPYGQSPQPYQPVAEQVAPPQPKFAMGLSAGYLMCPSGTGLLLGLEGTLWLNEVLGIEGDIGFAKVRDYSGGSETVVPLYVSVIATMPQGHARGPSRGNTHYRMGVGYGVAALGGGTGVPIVVLQFGYDWVMPSGGRVFTIGDLMMGQEDVLDEWGDPMPFLAVTFRIGMEWKL